jgi:hypothetical protein
MMAFRRRFIGPGITPPFSTPGRSVTKMMMATCDWSVSDR